MMKRLLAALLLSLVADPAFAQTNAATTNSSVTITTGNTFQTVLSAIIQINQRRSLTIVNNNTNGDNCWIIFGGGITAANAAKAKSIMLAPGSAFTRSYPYIPNDEIEATCTATSDTLYIDTQ